MPALHPMLPALALAASGGRQAVDPIAIGLFLAFVALTLAITWRVARRNRTRAAFYTAGGEITALQNGLAMAGDFDGMVYALGFLCGWPVLLFLVAEPLRALGRYTFADVLAQRLSERPMRIMAALNSLVIITLYLIGQMVGAGQLIELLFGLDYRLAVAIVGILMIVYVVFGGMAATTWVQIIKAGLFLCGAALLAVLLLARFHFDVGALFARAAAASPKRAAIFASGGLPGAASANFPVLVLAIYWRGLTTAGALIGGLTGLVSAVTLTFVGPAIWVKVLGHAAPLFPYDPPAIVTIPLAFLVTIGVSLATRQTEARSTLQERTSQA